MNEEYNPLRGLHLLSRQMRETGVLIVLVAAVGVFTVLALATAFFVFLYVRLPSVIKPAKYRLLLFTIAALVAAVYAGWITLGLLNAQTSITTALYTLAANITNTGTTDRDDIQVAVNVSAAALVDGNFIASDGLNAIVQKGSTDIPAMPPTNRIQVEGAVQGNGPTLFTEYTAAAQNTTTNDVQLLTTTPAVGDAFYFGADNPARVLTIDTDTAGVGTWTLTWEYWNGTAWTALASIDDRTTAFTTLGRRTVSWTMPTNWATTTVTGSSVNSFWARARVSAFTSITTQPLATRLFYENGQWWTWVETLPINRQEQYTIYIGGGTNLVSTHQIFPGTAGIITTDSATMEPGGSYSIGLAGRLGVGSFGSTICLACKTGAVTMSVTGSASAPSVTAVITGGGSTTLNLSPMTLPNTGTQTIVLASDGTNVALIATAGAGMATGAAQTVTNNANNWTWVSNGSVDYLNYARMDNATPTVFSFATSATDFSAGTLSSTTAYTGALGLTNQ